MKVLQIANDYLNTKLYVSLFNALGEIGINNVIFVPVQQNRSYRKTNDEERNDDSNLIISPCFTQVDRFVYFSKQNKLMAGIQRTVDLDNVAVTHAHTLFSAGYTAMKIKEKYRIPYIVTVRNTDVNVFFKKMSHLRGTGIEILNNASKVVFLSPSYMKKVLKEYVPAHLKNDTMQKCEVIPNGISEIFLKNMGTPHELDGNNLKLICAGEINRNKNLKETIDAARMLNAQGYHIEITAVGNVTDKTCKKWVEDPVVHHIPRCEQSKLLELYRKADLFVMPSHTETFGLVYAEAMSQGLPVLYTRGQGFDGHFDEGEVGYSVSDTNPGDIAQKIVHILDDYNRISRNCIHNVLRFDWKIIADKYSTIYRMLCRDRAIIGENRCRFIRV